MFNFRISGANGEIRELCFEGQSLFSFNVNESVAAVGTGIDDFSMSRGSFKHKDDILSCTELYLGEAKAEADYVSAVLTDRDKKAVLGLQLTQSSGLLKLHFTSLFDGEYNRFWLRLPAEKSEHIYGCGEVFNKLDLRGERLRIWVAEHQKAAIISRKVVRNVLLGAHPKWVEPFSQFESYYAQPTFVSSRKYFVHVDSSAYMDFDFRHKTEHRIMIRQLADIYIGCSGSFEQLSGTLSGLLGRQPQLPEWLYDGAVIAVQGGTENIRKKIESAKSANAALCGVWSQDWEGCRVTSFGYQLMWNWQWDEKLYPALPEQMAAMKSEGIRFLGYINTFLAFEGNLYKYAHEHGYCVKNKEGEDLQVTITTFPAALVDLTNPEAYEWLKGIIKQNMIGFGLDGWMADFGEYLPTDCVLYSGEDPKLVHNSWPAIWARLNREALEETGALGKLFFFTRAGYTDTVRYSTLMWNGDQHVDWSFDNGLPSVIPATLSLSMSGFGLTHSDVGGYTTMFFPLRRKAELMMRWSELCAFSPVMRCHEGNQPQNNVQFDTSEEILKHFARMSRIHRGLKNYLCKADKLNSEAGIPVVRPLFYHYDSERDFTEGYEYLLGRDLLVAPVLKKGARKRRVYLPNDTWVHLWTGKEYVGGDVKVDALLGYPPVFIRKGCEDFGELLELGSLN